MMKHKFTLSCLWGIFLVAFGMNTHAQSEPYNRIPAFMKANSVWFWGLWGFDFNKGWPSSFVSLPPSGVPPAGGVKVSVADPVNGQLLFYTNGHDCYDRTQKIMPDGQGLFGPSVTAKETLQGACAVPVIGQEGKYYLFSMFGGETYAYRFYRPKGGSLFYSVVDMALNNGRGNVVVGQKAIVLDKDTALSSAMIAIPGNNCDVWLVLHTVDEAKFKAYHITEAGVDPNPVVSVAGTQVSGRGALYWYAYSRGGMTVSPDRSKIVMSSIADNFPPESIAGDGVVVVNFDPNTGRASDGIKIDNTAPYAATLAFSPDGSKLYGMTGKKIGDTLGGSLYETDLVQYDLSVFSSAAVKASAVKLATQRTSGGSFNGIPYRYQANLKLYGDTIYMLQFYDTFFSTINNPNGKGLSADYKDVSIPFTDSVYGHREIAKFTFPAEVVYPQGALYATIGDTALCAEDIAAGITLTPSRSINYERCQWNTGAVDSVTRISEPGKYWVSYPALIGNCYSKVTDTFYIRVANPDPPVVTVNVDTLSTTQAYQSYEWYKDGQAIKEGNDRKLTVTQNGNYHVVVIDENGCVDTSDVYVVSNQNTSVAPLAQGDEDLILYPNPTQRYCRVAGPGTGTITVFSVDGRVVPGVHDAGQIDMGGCAPGLYWVGIRDKDERLVAIKKLVKLP